MYVYYYSTLYYLHIYTQYDWTWYYFYNIVIYLYINEREARNLYNMYVCMLSKQNKHIEI